MRYVDDERVFDRGGRRLSQERMEAIVETVEIMGNRMAMKAIRAYRGGGARFKDVVCLDEE